MKILLTGDFCPRDRLKEKIRAHDPTEVIDQKLLEIGRESDLFITNLECPVTLSSEPIAKTGPNLKTDDSAVSFLKKAGFNLVTLANNHIMDFGKDGLKDTIDYLNKAEMPYTGAGLVEKEKNKIFYCETDNIKLAVLNVTENEWSTSNGNQPGAKGVDPIENYYAIQEAKEKADKVIMIAHGGHEMYEYPSPEIRDRYRFYIDAGCNAVIAHHTHCVSGYEEYKGSPVFYSIGNFLFDHPKHRNAIWNKGLAVALNLKQNAITYEVIHFDQCTDKAKLRICDEPETKRRNSDLELKRKVIKDDRRLERMFEKWLKSKAKSYRSYIEPVKNRWINALQNRGYLPTLWSKRKKRYLLNVIRCESHREVLKKILENDLSHT